MDQPNTGSTQNETMQMQSHFFTSAVFILLIALVQSTLAKTSNEVLSAQTARAFAENLQNKNYAAIDKLIDIQAVCDQISSRLYDNAIKRKMFNLRECAVYKRRSFSTLMLQGVHSLSFSSRYIGKSQSGAHTVRLSFSEGGIEFIELFFDADDPKMVSDFYLATRGQRITRIVADNIALMSEDSGSAVKKLLGINEISPATSKKVQKIGQLIKRGDFKGALLHLDELPEELKHSKNFLVLKVTTSSNLDDDTYRAALSELDQYFGQDSSLTMLLLDYYIFEDDLEKLDLAFAKLKARYLGDASILNLEANIQFLKGNVKEARLLAEQSIAKEPSLWDGYYTKLYLLVGESKIEEAKATLKMMRERFDASVVDSLIQSDPSLAELEG